MAKTTKTGTKPEPEKVAGVPRTKPAPAPKPVPEPEPEPESEDTTEPESEDTTEPEGEESLDESQDETEPEPDEQEAPKPKERAVARHYRAVGFTDKSVRTRRGAGFYRAEAGRKDWLRVLKVPGMDVPVEIMSHYVESIRRGFNCAGPGCPICRQFGRGKSAARPKYVLPVLHTLSRKGAGKADQVQEVKRWTFAGETYGQLRDFVIPELDNPRDIYNRDITVACTDAEFQKVALGIAERSFADKAALDEWAKGGHEEFKRFLDEEFTVEFVTGELERALATSGNAGRGEPDRGRERGRGRPSRQEDVDPDPANGDDSDFNPEDL